MLPFSSKQLSSERAVIVVGRLVVSSAVGTEKSLLKFFGTVSVRPLFLTQRERAVRQILGWTEKEVTFLSLRQRR